jgi:transposase
VIGVPGNVRVYLACGVTDMRKGFNGLAARVQTVPQLDPHGGRCSSFAAGAGIPAHRRQINSMSRRFARALPSI